MHNSAWASLPSSCSMCDRAVSSGTEAPAVRSPRTVLRPSSITCRMSWSERVSRGSEAEPSGRRSVATCTILAEADAAAAHPGGIGALLRREGLYSSHLVTWRRGRQAGMVKGLTPHKRGPKSRRNPQEEEMQKLRRENQRLTEELRKAAIVIDVQKKVGALLGWPLPKAEPEEKP